MKKVKTTEIEIAVTIPVSEWATEILDECFSELSQKKRLSVLSHDWYRVGVKLNEFLREAADKYIRDEITEIV